MALQHAELSLKPESPDEAYVVKLRAESVRLKAGLGDGEPNIWKPAP